MNHWICIDGSAGEGGGQMLRSSLALSIITGKPFKMTNIRAKRAKPGLMRQHLTSIAAAAEISTAEVSGAAIGSQELTFSPGAVKASSYHFAVGTAGSATLVFQTVFPALLWRGKPFELVIEGGTHNPSAPPFHFLNTAYLGVVRQLGHMIDTKLERYGFYPAGGGFFSCRAVPSDTPAPVNLVQQQKNHSLAVHAVITRVPRHVAERECRVIADTLNIGSEAIMIEEGKSCGSGNVVMVTAAGEYLAEVFTGFGQIGVRAEAVAQTVIADVLRYVKTQVPVYEYLADQLILLMALSGKGQFLTVAPSPHTLTNIDVVKKFIDCSVTIKQTGRDSCIITMGE